MTRLASLLLCGCARARRARLGSSLCTASPARLEPLRASTRSRPCKRACWPAASISMWSPRAHPRRPMPRAALPSSRAIKRPRAVWSALGCGGGRGSLTRASLHLRTSSRSPMTRCRSWGRAMRYGTAQKATRHRSRCSRRCGRRRRTRRSRSMPSSASAREHSPPPPLLPTCRPTICRCHAPRYSAVAFGFPFRSRRRRFGRQGSRCACHRCTSSACAIRWWRRAAPRSSCATLPMRRRTRTS